MADDIKFVIGVDDRDLIKAQKEQVKFQRNLVTIEKAFRKGDITAGRYNAELAKQTKQLQALGGSYRKASSEVRSYAYALRQADDATLAQSEAMAFAGKRVNRLGVNLQQAGYQIGDFAVQVQGGTNVMVALGQQGAQLAGIFGPAGAIAGAGLAIATAFLAPLLKAKDSVKELEDQTIKSIENVDKKLKSSRLGVSEEELSFIDKLTVAQDKYTAALENFNSERAFLAGGDFSAKEIEELLLSDQQAMEQARLEASAASAEYERFKASRTALLAGVSLSAFGDEGDPAYSPEGLARAKAFQELVEKTRVSMGKVSTEATVLTQEVIDTTTSLGGSVEEAIKLQKALDQGKISASQLKGVDLEKGISPAVKAAKELAKQLGISFRLAAAMSGAIVRGADAEALDPRSARYDPAVARAARMKELMDSGDLYKDFPKAETKTKPSGGSKAEDLAAKAKQAFDSLRASYDETYATQLKVEQAQKTVNEAISLGVISASEGKNVFEEYKASLEALENPMLDLANTMSGAMSEAFMSIADGTASVKDAFSDMVRVVIKKAFEMAVINPIINSIFGGVSGFNPLATFSSGGAFSNGSVKAYADGGVVGGPTTFPMSGGKTGLMGEAGPEAIMPLKRGANGKLGVQVEGNSGGDVNIVQNFSFAANGDDSVKKLIAQAAPQIANMTQKQIMDSRRRGGAMKSTFG